MTETQETIRQFWFGSTADDTVVAQEKSRLWWAKDNDTDAAMRERFTQCIAQAAAGELDHWADDAHGLLALILLTDQFPRNIYRGTPQSFAFDARARAWCKAGLAEACDRLLRPIERVFFYLPLEHSEDLEDQEQSVALFSQLTEEAADRGGDEGRSEFAGFLDFAVRHRDIIRRFGRFPHRNLILGRVSSEEEQAFLLEKGSSF